MIGSRIHKLARAIANHEGWQPPVAIDPTYANGTMSYRFHNPGNLRSSIFQYAQKNGFAVFYNDNIGYAALIYDLWVKCSGKSTSGLTPDSTLRDLIFKYAPPAENDSEAYLASVVAQSGLKADIKLRELLLA